MQILNPEKRLEKFWGKVDKKHIQHIENFVIGKNILDMGCGKGTTTAVLTSRGFNCIGIDFDKGEVSYAKMRFPICNFQQANAEALPFEDNYFDTIILRDALHHFWGEADFKKVISEIQRVSDTNSRIIFFDPNVGILLKTMRAISSHKDEECTYEQAIEIMQSMHLKIIHSSFNTIYSLPLSGGYVGLNFIPNINWIQNFILSSESLFESIFNSLKIGRLFCWRYLIVGEQKKNAA